MFMHSSRYVRHRLLFLIKVDNETRMILYLFKFTFLSTPECYIHAGPQDKLLGLLDVCCSSVRLSAVICSKHSTSRSHSFETSLDQTCIQCIFHQNLIYI